MKYQNIQAFEKHLAQAAKHPLSRVFLVVTPCSYERRKIADTIFRAISSQGQPVQWLARESSETPFKTSLEELNTLSLFLEEKVLYLNGIDKLKKGDLSPLTAYVEKPSPGAYLILGAASAKGLTDLCTKGKKELITCDLSEEKPWDVKNRLKRVAVELAAHSKKRLSAESAEYLLDLIGPSLPRLEQELEKLITFAMEKQEITLADVRQLCVSQNTPPSWEIVEQIVWGNTRCKVEENVDLSLLLPLLSQIRNQLQQGMVATILRSRGAPASEMTTYFPTLRPAALEKLFSGARQKPIGFFKKSLDLLFETELLAKNSDFDPSWILDLLLAKLHLLKRI